LGATDFGKSHVCSDDGSPIDYTITLPAVAGNGGKILSLRMATALTKLVNVDANASELIDGVTNRYMWANETATLQCDGVGWTKIAGKTIPMRAYMYLGSAQTVTNSISTLIRHDTVLYDVGGLANTTAHQMKIRRAGQYFCQAQIYFTSGSAGYRWISVLNTDAPTGPMKAVTEVNTYNAGCYPVPNVVTTISATNNEVLVHAGYITSTVNTPILTGANYTPFLIVENPTW
jgi:hypothetical protein